MDTSILFNNNTPFDDNKLAVFDWVVNTFFSTKNNLEVKLKKLTIRENQQTNVSTISRCIQTPGYSVTIF